MLHRRYFTEKGQSLIFVALLLVALLAMLALILDGGYSYYQRRIAQNAADAGALAGARAYCLGQSPEADAGAMVQANDAVLESITYPLLPVEETVDPPVVEVIARIDFNTFFASIIGQPSVTARAIAAAGCFAPGGANVIPVAWSCRPPYATEPWDPDKCELQYMDDDDMCTYEDNDPIYIIADDIPVEFEPVCQNPPNSGTPPGAIDCDIDGSEDGINDIAGLQGGTKTWLDLNGGGGGLNELQDWIIGTQKVKVLPHYWVPSGSAVGDKTPLYGTVDEYLNQDFIIPIYDQVCTGAPPCNQVWHPADDVVIPKTMSADYFHIIGFTYFRPICIDSPTANNSGTCLVRQALEDAMRSHPLAPPNINGLLQNMKTIEGCFKKGFIPGVGGDPELPFTGTWTIYLIK